MQTLLSIDYDPIVIYVPNVPEVRSAFGKTDPMYRLPNALDSAVLAQHSPACPDHGQPVRGLFQRE